MDISKITNTMPVNQFKVKESETRSDDKKFAEPQLTRDNINSAVEMLNAASTTLNNRIAFSVDEKTDRVVMRVVDPDNNEVIREIPPKELIRLAGQIKEMIGIFIDASR